MLKTFGLTPEQLKQAMQEVECSGLYTLYQTFTELRDLVKEHDGSSISLAISTSDEGSVVDAYGKWWDDLSWTTMEQGEEHLRREIARIKAEIAEEEKA